MSRFAQLGIDMVKLWSLYGSSYLQGVWKTVSLAVICTAVGCVIGFICGILQTIPCTKKDNVFKRFIVALIKILVRIYVEVFRGTPMILQSIFIFYGLPYFTNNAVHFSSMWLAAFTVVSINTGAYMAESVRGGILSIDVGQNEGAKAIGMTHSQTMLNVILPQALRNIMPQIGNNLIINLKDTAVMFAIGYTELFAVHRQVAGATYLYFPSATIEMILYLTLTLISSFLLRWWENRMDGSDSYDLATKDTLAHTSGLVHFPGNKEKVSKTGNLNLDKNERGR